VGFEADATQEVGMDMAADVETVAAALEHEQARVARALRRLQGRETLAASDRDRLVALGHFPDYAEELGCNAGQVAGHLRESAEVFWGRVRRLSDGAGGVISDFDPYRRAESWADCANDQLLPGLLLAQADLLAAVRSVGPRWLLHSAMWEDGTAVTLRGLLEFLPMHQRDHAEQLAAMLAVGQDGEPGTALGNNMP
jgi:hypothetical protein